LVALDAVAQRAPRPLAIPIGRTGLELGAGYDAELSAERGEPGACVVGGEIQRSERAGAQYSIAALTQVGGRLVVGVHVSVPLSVEVLVGARVTDAARRLQQAAHQDFRELCGDGFVAARTIGDHFLAEVAVQRKDVLHARTFLQAGTWTEPEPFRQALEALVKHHGVVVRELPGGSRVAARPLTVEELSSRVLAFPASVTPENARPYLAAFEPYSDDSFAGMPLPQPGELEAIEVADEVFRERGGRPRSTAAERSADMHAAQVHRTEPEEPPSRPFDAVDRTQPARVDRPEPLAAPAREIRVEPEPAPPAAPAPEPRSATAKLQSQPALVFGAASELPVYATTHAPGGVYAERVRQREYWVPGAATATPAVTRAIEKARAETPSRGTTVVIAEVGTATVVMTDAAPAGATHSEAAGERRAWIAGVVTPDAAQRAAIAAAIEAEARAQ
jgi:hypothetical protein